MEFCAFYKSNSTIITACFHSPIKSHKSLFIKRCSLTQPCPGQGLGYSCISSRREMHQLIVPTSAAGLSEVCTSSLILHINQNKPNSWALPLPARACQLLYVLNSLKCSSQSSSLSRTWQCFQHMDLQISRNSTRYHQVRKTAQHTSMLPCKAVISKYLIYAQLPSHEPQHFAFRTKLWQRNLTQCTDLGMSSPHRLSAMLTLETGKRKKGMLSLMPSPALWWVKIFIVAECHYNYQAHGVSRSAVGGAQVCVWTVSVTSGRTTTMSRSPLSAKLSSLFIFCSITSLTIWTA